MNTILSFDDFKISDINRFWSKVFKTDHEYECWEWQAHKDSCGYGRFQGGKRKLLSAHRVAFFLEKGYDPKDLHVLHKCDNPCCCNISHLFLGTHADNMIDREIKKRANHPSGSIHWTKVKRESLATGERNGAFTHPDKIAKGERNGHAKLKESDISNIRYVCHNTSTTFKNVAIKYNISIALVNDIYHGKSWKHIPLTYIPKIKNKGEGASVSKLTDKDVIKIRKLYNTGKYSYRELATMFLLAFSSVSCIIKGKTWKHLLS